MRFLPEEFAGESSMFRSDLGKLTVYSSEGYPSTRRLGSVKTAAEQMARQLNLSFEMVKQKRGCSPIYVYYDCGDADPVPIYCDEGKTGNSAEISSKIRSMMFVLSFHPRHSALRQARKMLFTLS